MTWTVIWRPSSQNQLAEIWIQGPEREAITKASHRIDQTLRADPFANSESRQGNSRVLFEPPLAVAFDVKGEGRGLGGVAAAFSKLDRK